MNILIDALPTAVEINGKEYEITTDFRAVLRVIMAFEDSDLAAIEKQMIMLQNLYPVIPDDLKEAIQKAVKFINGGVDSKDDEDDPGPRVYSFSKDAGLIFSAFQQTHGIDLETAEMHWWKFLALFMDLGQDTAFCQLVGLRKRVKTGKASKEERQAAREMGDVFDIPEVDDRTLGEREREAEFMRLVNAGAGK